MVFLKHIWLHIFKSYLGLGLFFYYKTIKVRNAENIPRDQAVLILSNHQNALLDALLIATKSPRFVYFLTRASVFKKPLVKRFLSTLQMLPVYRVRDGWNNLPKNAQIFETCSRLLSRKQAVVVFPEGSHNLKRTVRPLSKGFTRIVFKTLHDHPDLKLQLLPVGLNFQNATGFKDSVCINFGTPFLANDYLDANLHKATLRLKETVQIQISQLTTHIPTDHYDTVLESLQQHQVDFLEPEIVNAHIKNGGVTSPETKGKPHRHVISFVLKQLMIVLLMGPYLVWRCYVQPKIVEREFTGTFRFAVALTLVPLWILFLGGLVAGFIGWPFGLGFVIMVLLLQILTVKI